LLELVHQSGKIADIELEVGGPMPFSRCTLFNFETTAQPEAILLLNTEAGTVLINCDSI